MGILESYYPNLDKTKLDKRRYFGLVWGPYPRHLSFIPSFLSS